MQALPAELFDELFSSLHKIMAMVEACILRMSTRAPIEGFIGGP